MQQKKSFFLLSTDQLLITDSDARFINNHFWCDKVDSKSKPVLTCLQQNREASRTKALCRNQTDPRSHTCSDPRSPSALSPLHHWKLIREVKRIGMAQTIHKSPNHSYY